MHWEYRNKRTTLCMRIKKGFIKTATLGKRHEEWAGHLPVGKMGWGREGAGKSEVVRKGRDDFWDHSLSQERERQQPRLKISGRGDPAGRLTCQVSDDHLWLLGVMRAL